MFDLSKPMQIRTPSRSLEAQDSLYSVQHFEPFRLQHTQAHLSMDGQTPYMLSMRNGSIMLIFLK